MSPTIYAGGESDAAKKLIAAKCDAFVMHGDSPARIREKIEELKLLARGVFVLDANGKVVYAETVKEVASEPNYDAALQAIKSLL